MKSCLIVKPHMSIRKDPTAISDLKQHYFQTALAVDFVAVITEGGYRILKNRHGVIPKDVVTSITLDLLLDE